MSVIDVPVSGYSTQARLSLEISGIINNKRIRFWFASEFNPLDNEKTSRPIWIFEELDRAAKNLPSEKASLVADNLRAWVNRWQQDGFIDRDTQAHALHAIKNARFNRGFEPRVFYLKGIIGAVKEQQPDEYRIDPYLIDDAWQILPPEGIGSSGLTDGLK